MPTTPLGFFGNNRGSTSIIPTSEQPVESCRQNTITIEWPQKLVTARLIFKRPKQPCWPGNTSTSDGPKFCPHRRRSAKVRISPSALASLDSGRWQLAASLKSLTTIQARAEKFGYSFGTLPRHPEQGEERFELHCSTDNIVTFRITAFFRPNYLSAKFAWPYFRYRFNRFRRQSVETLRQHVQSSP